jgi:hypothetical protein
MTATCPHCGATLPASGDAYCPDCRGELDGETTEARRNVQAAVARPAVAVPATGREEASIEYGGIQISDTLMAELDGHRTLVAVKRSNIERATLHRGWQSQRPFILLLFGVGLLVIAVFPIRVVLHWLLEGGNLHVVWPFAAVFILVVALWVMYDSLRRGFSLVLEGPKGQQKLCFGRRAVRWEIEAFLDQAEQRFGYQVERA